MSLVEIEADAVVGALADAVVGALADAVESLACAKEVTCRTKLLHNFFSCRF